VSGRLFPYAFDGRWKPMFVVLGVGSDDGVTVGDDGSLVATFGRVRVVTTLDNVHHTQVTGPHRWYTAVGLRLSFSDDGLTFGTNHHRGLCIEFHDRVPRVIGFKPHSTLWVSVADPEGLAEAIG
jgi:hypothetical protein